MSTNDSSQKGAELSIKIEVYNRGKYRIVKIRSPMNVISDLTELNALITGYLKSGFENIAVSFTDSSYLYSGAVSVLINCFKMVREHGGDLCILEPNANLLDLIMQMNIDSIIDVYSHEDELPDT
jgi:anti-anti-sigma factor